MGAGVVQHPHRFVWQLAAGLIVDGTDAVGGNGKIPALDIGI